MVACGSNQTAEVKVAFKLNGAGATFPAPLYNSWFQSFNKETGNQVNYQAVGSGAGVRQYTAKTVDFGASDGAVSQMLSRNCR
jgi:phosphate transport system substrate-binding protein